MGRERPHWLLLARVPGGRRPRWFVLSQPPAPSGGHAYMAQEVNLSTYLGLANIGA